MKLDAVVVYETHHGYAIGFDVAPFGELHDGSVAISASLQLDSGPPQTAWRRIYLGPNGIGHYYHPAGGHAEYCPTSFCIEGNSPEMVTLTVSRMFLWNSMELDWDRTFNDIAFGPDWQRIEKIAQE